MEEPQISFAQAMGYFRDTLIRDPAQAMRELMLDLSEFSKTGVVLSPEDVAALTGAFREATDMIRGAQELSGSFQHSANELAEISLTDALTGIGNRRAYDEELKRALAFVERNPNNKVVVLATDLRGLKSINDNLGEQYGDAAIVAMAQTADEKTREGEKFYRTGGDEIKGVFVIDKDINANTVLARWQADLSDIRVNFENEGAQFRIKTYQAVVEVFPTDTPEAIAERATNALNQVKRAAKADRTDLSASIEMIPAGEVREPLPGAHP